MFTSSMMAEVLQVAEGIAAKSPVAVQGTKMSLVYSRDHSVQEGLDHIVCISVSRRIIFNLKN